MKKNYAITYHTSDDWNSVSTVIVASEKDPRKMDKNELFDLFLTLVDDSDMAWALVDNRGDWFADDTEAVDLDYEPPVKITITLASKKPREDADNWSYDVSELGEVLENLDYDQDYYYFGGRLYEKED